MDFSAQPRGLFNDMQEVAYEKWMESYDKFLAADGNPCERTFTRNAVCVYSPLNFA